MRIHPKPRPDVISLLAEEALKSMDGMGIDDLTAAEILSACFTMTKRVVKTILAECEKSELDNNIDQITNAIGDLFSQVPKKTVH